MMGQMAMMKPIMKQSCEFLYGTEICSYNLCELFVSMINGIVLAGMEVAVRHWKCETQILKWPATSKEKIVKMPNDPLLTC